MAAKGLAVLVVPVLVLVASAGAQDLNRATPVNEISVTAGRTFVSTQTIQNPTPDNPNPHIHFGNRASFDVDYARLLMSHRIFGLYAELPVGIFYHMDLNTFENKIPQNISALFMTPSLRMNIFSGQAVTPWVSAGGGYGRFWNSSNLVFGGTNPGPGGTNTGVVQFGAGLDVWPWRNWGGRIEARDFYSGAPDLNVDTGRSRQHNYYVGIGVVRRF
ncbi:MAG TPA: hypothetical protein VJX30_05630 [Terriglobales bacterium]|jgi:hypothetical protein|nr:hypothetical protein [Terriglobales bacterium]